MLFNINLPVQIISGENCILNNYEKFAVLGEKALIVTGKSSAKKSGALDDVVAALGKSDIEYRIFDKIEPNPLTSTCFKGGAAAKEFGADFIIGIGGGSALDAARAISCYAASDFWDSEDIFLDFSKNLPLITIGTTAGTGSEVDGASVLTTKNGEKCVINAHNLFAKYCFADYRYTCSNSYAGTVSTALDALCHALENWFSTTATEPACVAAARSVELIYPWLKKLADGYFEPRDMVMRQELYYGSLWAGVAITMVGTGFPHMMGYSLTETGHLTHGIACAVFEADFVKLVLPHIPENQRRKFLSIIGSVEEMEAVISKLTVNNITVNEKLMEQMAARAINSNNGKRTPGGLTLEQAREIVKKTFYKEDQAESYKGGWQLSK